MITLLVDRHRRILLVRYATALTIEALDRLDGMLQAFFAREAAMDVIADFTAVPDGPVETSVLVDRGHRPARTPLRRVFIVNGPLQFGIMRLYGSYQECQGYVAPDLVHSLAEALDLLQAPGARFEPVDA